MWWKMFWSWQNPTNKWMCGKGCQDVAILSSTRIMIKLFLGAKIIIMGFGTWRIIQWPESSVKQPRITAVTDEELNKTEWVRECVTDRKATQLLYFMGSFYDFLFLDIFPIFFNHPISSISKFSLVRDFYRVDHLFSFLQCHFRTNI